MYPELFHIGSVTIHSFGVMMALAFVTAGVVTAWQFRRKGLDPELTYSLLIAAIVGGVVGSKVHYLIVHPDQFRVASFSGSGLIWYGGLFGGALAVFVVARLAKPRVAVIADAIAPALAAAYAVGRVGCLLNGDDYGVPTSLPWGLSFPKGSPPTTVDVHPTQIYESLASLAILALLVWVVAPRLRRDGSLFWAYLGFAGVERFLVEFVRTNDPVALGLTQAQWTSIMLLVAGVVGFWWLERRSTAGGSGRVRPAPAGGRVPPRKAQAGSGSRSPGAKRGSVRSKARGKPGGRGTR